MNPNTPEFDVYDMVCELTSQHQHRERYDYRPEKGPWIYGLYHATKVPALVRQLVGATPAGSGEMSGSGAKSKPAARIEALDTLMLIDDEAGEWIDKLGGVIPSDPIDPDTLLADPAAGTARRLLRLHGLHPATEVCDASTHRYVHGTPAKDDQPSVPGGWCCVRGELEHDVRSWWLQARIITGWDSAAWRPRNTCPVCEVSGGLRIKLELQAALCIECRARWDASSIGLLADHIRAENLDDGLAADEPQVEATESNLAGA